MKCTKCGIEMTRVREGVWTCRNPKCPMKGKEQKNGGK